MEALSVFMIVGLSFSFIFLVKRLTGSDVRTPVRFLPVVIISILTIEIFYGWLYSTRYILQVPHLLRLNTPLLYLIGPGFYFLILSFSAPGTKWKSPQLLHLIPFILSIFYLVPVFGSSGSEKVVYAESLYSELSFDSFLLGGTRRIHQGIYLIFTIILIHRKRNELHFHRELRSSILVTTAFALLWAISIYRYLFSFDLLTALLDTTLLSFIAIFIVYRQLSLKNYTGTTSSGLNPDQMDAQKKKIEQLLNEEKGYLNPEYSIKDMAAELDLSVPAVSKIINRGMNTNFNELINRYKVNEAINLLKSEDNMHLTIEAIARNAGFNSTSAFNENFKKITGKLPKSFRKTSV